jgi:hypothetical protein
MAENSLHVPGLLLDLVARGVWSADWNQADRFEAAYPTPWDDEEQRGRRFTDYGPPQVPVERIRLIHATEWRLCLTPPPFLSSRDRTMCAWDLPVRWKNFFAPQEIDRDLIIEIGDFGRGSDQPIILDYQANPSEPNVRRLACNVVSSGPDSPSRAWDNHWFEIAGSFEEFAQLLGLI